MYDHPRESALELYVLRSDSLGDTERDALCRHLDACAGCRDLAGRMDEFYGDLRAELVASDPAFPVLSPEELPLKVNQTISRHRRVAPAIREVETGLPFRVARWIVRNPFAAASAALLAFGALSAFVLLRPGGAAVERVEDFNPVSVRMSGTTLVVLNRLGQVVGETPGSENLAMGYETHREAFERLTRLVDVDGDGRNELVWADRNVGGLRTRQVIRCVSFHPDNVRWSHEVRLDPSTGGSREWATAAYGVGKLEAGELDGAGSPEVYVLLASDMYPAMVLKLDAATGGKTGAYLHPGGLLQMKVADVDLDGSPEIVVCGMNNAFNDAVVAILDPARIGGIAPCTADYGIEGMEPAGEKAYIRIPRTIVGLADPGNPRSRVKDVKYNTQNNTLRASVIDNPEIDDPPDLHIVFRQDLSIELIEPGDGYSRDADDLYAAGMIDRAADDRYLLEYANEILWWDGEAWQNHPTWNRRSPQVTASRPLAP